jgi:hypothetical protein
MLDSVRFSAEFLRLPIRMNTLENLIISFAQLDRRQRRLVNYSQKLSSPDVFSDHIDRPRELLFALNLLRKRIPSW